MKLEEMASNMIWSAVFRKRQRVDEDDVASDDDEQDDFYDRTKTNIEKKQKAAVVVHDAASLYGRKVGSSKGRIRWRGV